MVILTILILPPHEYGIFFHLFVSSSVSFISIFNRYKALTSLVKIIPRYFIFPAHIKEIVF